MKDEENFRERERERNLRFCDVSAFSCVESFRSWHDESFTFWNLITKHFRNRNQRLFYIQQCAPTHFLYSLSLSHTHINQSIVISFLFLSCLDETSHTSSNSTPSCVFPFLGSIFFESTDRDTRTDHTRCIVLRST